MKIVFVSVAAVTAALAFSVGTATGNRVPDGLTLSPERPRVLAPSERPNPKPKPRPSARAQHELYSKIPTRSVSYEALNEVIQNYCGDCHNDQLKSGNQSFDHYDVATADKNVAVSEKMIRKLRTEMMPLPGAPRPGGDTLKVLVSTIEDVIDRATKGNPGFRVFPRLNRTEYERVVKDLLDVTINAGDYLPLDTKSANFDNIADVQALSTTLLESYLNAGAAVTRMALGDKNATPLFTTYQSSPFVSQHPWDHVDGAPYGTRGGLVALHTFPADGWYQVQMNVEGGVGTKLEDVDVSIDGHQVALLKYEKGINVTRAFADKPLGVDILKTDSIFVKAGQQTLSVAFVRRSEGPYEDLIRPHDWSFASSGNASSGTTTPPRIIDMMVMGPKHVTGVSETPSRKIVFSCRPSKTLSENACAEQIITRLGTRAYRRPLTKHDKDGLMAFYTSGAKQGGFEEGIRSAMQAMLASPHFIFRFEPIPANATPGQDVQISDIDLASRLSFFLWGSIPDDQLLTLATQKKLSNPKTLEAQIKRMLADPRADALSTRFAAQWLRLQDLDKVRPDAYFFPDYDQQLADAMKEETIRFFTSIVKEDRSVLDLFSADYTFVNERLARHYGIPNISGTQFQRVTYPDSTRRGLLGQGSILVQTSLANRTSPVLRGKWVMEVLIGMPPPPPPANVPALDETKDAKDGKQLTTRERMEIHRKDPTCRTCHQYMDPIGLSLDNFDVTGKWRWRENGMELDTRGNFYDGTKVGTPTDLIKVLLKRPIPLVRAFTENLMAYSLGRRVEDYDQPQIREIVREAEAGGYKFSSLINGVVNSSAFRSKRVEPVSADQDNKQQR